jgi:hypothetical protein
LLDKLINSSDKEVRDATKQLTELLKNSEYKDHAGIKAKPILDQTQKAIEQETQAINKALSRLKSDAGDKGQDLELEEIAKKVLETNIKLIKDQSNKYSFDKSVNDVKISLRKDLFKDITDPQLQKALISIALESLARLETMYERTQTKIAKNYKRITQQNAGSKDKIIYATALMNRDNDYKVSRKSGY